MHCRRAAMDVEEAHRAAGESWQIAWADAFPFSAASEKCLAQMVFSGGSVCAWNHQSRAVLEAVQLLNFSPTLIMKLGPFERQVVHYGARCGILSADMAGRLAYLAEKEKYFSMLPCLIRCVSAMKKRPPPRCFRRSAPF